MAKKRGLGRGFNELISSDLLKEVELFESETSAEVDPHNRNEDKNTTSSKASSRSLLELNVDQIIPGRYQPRKAFDETELQALADSIKTQGVIQPIVVRSRGDDKYEIIAGERRWRASRLAGLTQVPVVIKNVSDETALALAIIENIQRENLNPMEEAYALDRLAKEFGLTHIQVAETVGKSRAGVTNSLRLLGLTEDVKRLLESGELEAGHAKVLLALRGHEQSQVAKIVVAKGLSVRETERLVAHYDDKTEESTLAHQRRKGIDPDVQKLQQSLTERLGAMVEIEPGKQGKGKIIITYNSLDELDGILEKIQ